jgi:RNA polymerase sigma factor (sigma-70 family)
MVFGSRDAVDLPGRMDQLLLPYLQATDDSERQQCLDELLLLHAAPVVRKILRSRLGFHVSQQGANRKNQEAEDIYQGTLTKIVQKLHDLIISSSRTEIENFRRYVTRIAINACNDFLRARSPGKYRFKHNIRDIFTRHQDFAAWKVDDEIVGGFAVWQGTDRLPASERQVRELENDLDAFLNAKFANEDIHQVPLTKVVAEVLQWIDCPIKIDDLAWFVALLLRIKDQPTEAMSLDEGLVSDLGLAQKAIAAESAVAAKELLNRVWQIVKRMPIRQRDTFCFAFEDERGADLFSLLLEKGIAGVPQIAQALGRSSNEITLLRSRMPMDYVAIAAELNGTRSQVTQWHYRALQRLEKELGSSEIGRK